MSDFPPYQPVVIPMNENTQSKTCLIDRSAPQAHNYLLRLYTLHTEPQLRCSIRRMNSSNMSVLPREDEVNQAKTLAFDPLPPHSTPA